MKKLMYWSMKGIYKILPEKLAVKFLLACTDCSSKWLAKLIVKSKSNDNKIEMTRHLINIQIKKNRYLKSLKR